ncbi:MAG TPA: type VII secretion target [Mycobacterium sp.]|nr:type VII secretion target [Mycobacterium sp.]
MFADTEAIRIFGATNSAQAADLAAVADALSALPDTAAASLGPVGARLVAALAEAAAETSRAVTALADRFVAGCHTAHASAAAYEDADERTGAVVSGVR